MHLQLLFFNMEQTVGLKCWSRVIFSFFSHLNELVVLKTRFKAPYLLEKYIFRINFVEFEYL